MQEAIAAAQELERTGRSTPASLRPAADRREPLGIGSGAERADDRAAAEESPGPEFAPPGKLS